MRLQLQLLLIIVLIALTLSCGDDFAYESKEAWPTYTPYPTATAEAYMFITGPRVDSPSGRISVRMPEGWAADTEFGKTVMPTGMRPDIDFFGGKYALANYDPSILITSHLRPNRVDINDLVDAEIANFGITNPDAEVSTRSDITVDGHDGITFEAVDAEFIYPLVLRSRMIVLLINGEHWNLQCISTLESDDPEYISCQEALTTVDFP